MTTTSRGQLIIVGALLLAALLVGVAVVLNSAIYAGNLATRTDPGIDSGPVTFHRTAVTGTAGAIEYVNDHHDPSHDALTRNLTAMVDDVTRGAGDHYATRGASVDVTLVTPHNGTRIRQTNESRNFTAGGSAAGDGNWTLVTDARDVREFRMNVSNRSLVAATVDDVDTVLHRSFRVTVTNGTHTWRLYTFYDTVDEEVVVFDERPGESLSDPLVEYCAVDADWVTIDVTRGTVDGDPCPAVASAGTITGARTIEYHNANDTVLDTQRVAGTYDLFVNESSVDQSVYHDPDTGRSPFTTAAIYSARITTTYHGPTVTVERTERVVP